MAKRAALQIVTANHLLEGHSIFLCKQGWSADHSQALIANGLEEAEALESRGRIDEDANIVVGVYLVAVELDGNGKPQPTHYREKMRVRARPSFWSDAPENTVPAAKPVQSQHRLQEAAYVSL